MIPFIYVFADGKGLGQVAKEVARPPDIQVLADRFILRGGRYVITKFVDDTVQLQAVMLGLDDKPHSLASQTVPDGPLLLGAIDQLVRETDRKLNVQ